MYPVNNLSIAHVYSPNIIAMLYSMGPRIHMHAECMGREQSSISILIWLIKKSRVLFLFISPTWYGGVPLSKEEV